MQTSVRSRLFPTVYGRFFALAVLDKCSSHQPIVSLYIRHEAYDEDIGVQYHIPSAQYSLTLRRFARSRVPEATVLLSRQKEGAIFYALAL